MGAEWILALDVATTTGWAYGRPGEVPRASTKQFAPEGSDNGAVGCGAMRWLADFLKMNQVDAVYYEAPFDPRHMGNKTTFSTTRVLVGLPFLLDTLLSAKSIKVREVLVADARKHFLGRGVRGDEGKKQVQTRCRQLGWRFDSPDAADACAVWAFACGIENPKAAIATTPLFQPGNVATKPSRSGTVGTNPTRHLHDDIEEIPW
ncbi:hypothetical protein [Xanthobacter flavus]|uniref:hypothetical protein n=1 Tax=Xanthobacter flavus TaxID=281 RepID=UPI00372B9E36